jgi:YHS domain-containing protein
MMVKDVVCGLIIDAKDATGKSQYEGETYYFCSRNCKAEFDRTLKSPPTRRTCNNQRPVRRNRPLRQPSAVGDRRAALHRPFQPAAAT